MDRAGKILVACKSTAFLSPLLYTWFSMFPLKNGLNRLRIGSPPCRVPSNPGTGVEQYMGTKG